MLKIVIASLLGIVTVCSSGTIIHPVFWLLPILALVVLWFACRSRAGHFNFTLTYSCVIIFAVSGSWASYQARDYLSARQAWQSQQKWLVEIAERPTYRFKKGSTKLVLICRYQVSAQGLEQCLKTSSLQWLFPYYVLAALPPQAGFPEANFGTPGQRWRMNLDPASLAGSGAGFDRERWALTERVVTRVKVDLAATEFVGINRGIAYWRDQLKQRLFTDSHIERSSYSGLTLAPLLQALTLGDRQGMTSQHWQLLRETGTTHLLAISGLHLGLIGGWFYWLSAAFVSALPALNHRVYPQFMAAMVALLVAAVYSVMVGLSLPTQRAFLMLLCAVSATFSNHPRLLMNALAIALLVILFVHPFAVLSASLWLSFAAVAMVFMVIGNRLNGLSVTDRKGWQLLKIQVVLFLGMLPLTAYFFSGVSLQSFVANLIAIPMVTLVLLPLCFINAITVAMGVVSESLSEILHWLMDTLLCAMQWITNQLDGFVYVNISWSQLAAALVGLLLLLAPLNLLTRCVGLVMMLVSLIAVKNIDPNIILYAQSQPLLLIQQGTQQILIDATPGLSYRETGALQNMIPVVQDSENVGYWQQSWLNSAWAIYTLDGNPGNLAFSLPQGLQTCDDYLPANSLEPGVSHWRAVQWIPDDSSTPVCFFAFRWQQQSWLLLGTLSLKQQRQLVAGDVLRQNAADNYVMAGDHFVGALLNPMQHRRVFLWGHKALRPEIARRFAARNIELRQLAESGSLVIKGGAEPLILPLKSRRFYHLSTAESPRGT